MVFEIFIYLPSLFPSFDDLQLNRTVIMQVFYIFMKEAFKLILNCEFVYKTFFCLGVSFLTYSFRIYFSINIISLQHKTAKKWKQYIFIVFFTNL